MNSGMKGMRPREWTNYIPILDVWADGAGGRATPTLGRTTGYGSQSWGRYLFEPELHRCTFDFVLQFASAGNNGGNGPYLISLPIPHRLELGQDSNGTGVTTYGGANASDRPMGYGHVSQGISENPNVPLFFISADYGGLTYGESRRDWTQAFCPYGRMAGSFSTTAVTSKAIAWPGGITLLNTPTASQIQIMPTNVGGAAAPFYISAVSTTGFTVSWAAINTGAYSWQLMTDTTLVLGSNAPFNVGGNGDTIKGTCIYETEI